LTRLAQRHRIDETFLEEQLVEPIFDSSRARENDGPPLEVNPPFGAAPVNMEYPGASILVQPPDERRESP